MEAGALTQGAVVALYNYLSQILVELIKLANLIITVTRAVACGNRIQAVLDTAPTMADPAPGAPAPAPLGDAAIEFHGVALRYPGAGEAALTGVTLRVGRGQTLGVIGGTGAGKSSLVNLIPRFYDASEGSVSVGGTDVRAWPLQALRARIGMVPQQAMLFRGTLRDNLRWGKPDATDAELWAALDAAQARNVAEEKGGLDFMIDQAGHNLSGGQKQRLTIARALVRNPDILILDDSASALDYATDAALRAAIRNLPNRPTVIVVSQRAASLQAADQILVLDDGAVAGLGAGAELLSACPVYREIYESQFPAKEGEAHAQER